MFARTRRVAGEREARVREARVRALRGDIAEYENMIDELSGRREQKEWRVSRKCLEKERRAREGTSFGCLNPYPFLWCV